MRVKGTLFESFEEQEVEDILSNYFVVKGKCVLVILSQQLYLITISYVLHLIR
jgi:hypothetical protein